ncbi:S-adenosyl-L-methionine-dependent methyltransferase [Aspergillus homomorphus CBS 101889]|uniref:S-adenosyl-L-methionine-dependent methyltransferase n=1 Tax=Aspergillus homomorphus (strain CBS 101889) TaxID=1450537 RepID=A0A395HK97_ASPHC|nr:S-adenosyl-L-methionine-dependent methyltransferase [Aspergillus homomorphus CBS 101889]RAL08036.1 S-adenosyl-L-methionine-dependent methyltransferase [Aspergillus homomorphus CBS 101889]
MALRLLSSRGFTARRGQLRPICGGSYGSQLCLRTYSSPAHPPRNSVTELLEKAQAATKVYLDYVKSQGLPEPSYQHGEGLDPMRPLPRDVQIAKEDAIEATYELHHLLLGPMGLLFTAPGDQPLLMTLQYIYRYRLAAHVPLEGTVTFEELSKITQLNIKDVTRFLRVAISRHIFNEPKKGVVEHTATSKLLVDNPMIEAWLLNIAQEFWPAFARTVDATEKWPGSEEPNETGYALAHGTTSHPFDEIRKHPARHEQFITAMRFSHLHPDYHLTHLLNNYDFDRRRTKDTTTTTVVDIGGSNGEVSTAIAERYPDVRCIVQDLPDTIAGLAARVPAAVAERVTGMAHDFLTPQPVFGADVYLLRWILHDWSDTYAVKILRNLTPALKPGARVVVNDICIPEPGVLGPKANRDLRYMDIAMKSFNNARERDAETWEALFTEAHPQYRFLGVTVPVGARMAIIEAEWVG